MNSFYYEYSWMNYSLMMKKELISLYYVIIMDTRHSSKMEQGTL